MDASQVAEQLGLDGSALRGTELLSTRHGHRVWRVHTGEGSFVIKWFPDTASAAVEIGAYQLLRELGVPTLRVYNTTADALLLEDLGSSVRWRPASESDVATPAVGAAVGRWYKTLHQRGSELLERDDPKPFLQRETAALDAQALSAAARALGLVGNPAWQLAMDSLDLLKLAESRLGATLCYNDFHWTNLALTPTEIGSTEAVVYDYHLLGIGMRYSDCRNVVSSLGPEAAAAFWAEYGSVDRREKVIDRPLSAIHALVVASGLPQFPRWAQESRESVVNGALLRDLEEAISLAEKLL